jgi:transposase
MEAITIGLDIAKSVFQAHGIDGEGEVVVGRQLRRSQVIPFFEKLPACLIGIEACPTAHHWSRALQALGHEVRLMPPSYVKPYVKRSKNDAADAAAICEAVTRPTMRFVATKSAEQQSVLMLHRSRELLVRQRTMLVNAIRGHMAEFGIVAPVGLPRVKELLAVIADREDERIPPLARTCLESLAVQLMSLEREIRAADRRIHAWHRSNQVSQRLASIPGIGPNHGQRAGGVGPRPYDLQVRAGVGGMDRIGAQAELHRRQAAARAHLQTGRSVSQMAAGGRRHDDDPPCQAQRHHEPAVAGRPHRSQADQSCRRRLGQQDRPHRLGAARPTGELSSSQAEGAGITALAAEA